MRRPKILVVDDEPMIQKVLERVIEATIPSDITTASSGYQALGLLKREPFDVVITDFSMPGMDGPEFLAIVKDLRPDAVRLIFTGNDGADSALRAVDVAHQYFLKPTAMMTISDRIQRVLKIRDLLPEACSLEQIVSQIETLPSIPAVYHELEVELHNPDVSMEKIGKIVAQDISLSAKVLQLVNSAFFGLREGVSNPAQASTLLGLKVLQALILTTHIFSEWKDKKLPGFSIHDLWDHSLGTAAIAQEIALAEAADTATKEDLYVAALFHDIGKLIVAANLPDSYLRVREICRKDKVSEVEAEIQVMGVSHAEAGAYLLAVWGFSDAVVNGSAFHHHPERHAAGVSPDTVVPLDSVAIVHVADVFEHETRGDVSPTSLKLNAAYLRSAGVVDRIFQWRSVATLGQRASVRRI
ncbi:MAG: hypothetical protein A3K19_12230 [Lentisphaerae bacterium RIFOXYB12_FULL_65_16]|nr:MAG: hypothetical protein A3K18_28085 [Lentisphaerae bacterium RIFOXYA12_64_32]OGV86174.1 MAG: hypothetical protein A3K19_12230 [Lentisphaerae bacterium RIFOXYB12_FULL_65_16]